MLLMLAFGASVFALSMLWARVCRRMRNEWSDYLAAEQAWMRRVESGEFGDDYAAMNAAHPRRS